jgi:hypothetical protein
MKPNLDESYPTFLGWTAEKTKGTIRSVGFQARDFNPGPLKYKAATYKSCSEISDRVDEDPFDTSK